ncbi:glycosyltransferase [Oculatella sp. LEGE 06141]|nr:glycosyltransferase [Oculatella sp. LEGE 06141]
MVMSVPVFSVIIPTYSRPVELSRCLMALAQLDYSRDRFEVIVVDDGSDPPPDSVVAPFQTQLNLTLIRQPNSGPAQARNTGAAVAKGMFLAFTDDDCTPAADWLTQLEAHFTVMPDRLIGGKTNNALPDNACATTSQLIIDLVYAYYNANPQQARFFASNNFAVSAEQFRAMGGFNPTFFASEDREFCDRWLDQGYSMLYAPDVQINHAHPLTLRRFWQQHFNYGRGAYRFYQHRSPASARQTSPDFYLRLLTYPLVQTTSTHSKLILFALLVFSQVASTGGLLGERFYQSSSRLKQVNQT